MGRVIGPAAVVGRLVVYGLVGWGRTWRWCHPSGSCVWAKAVVAAAAGVEAPEKYELWTCRQGWLRYSRKAEEDEKGAAHDDSEGYPAPPAVPAGVAVIVAAALESVKVPGQNTWR